MFYKNQWAWQGVKLGNSIDVNFHLQQGLDIFDKNSADNIWSKKDKGVENALPHAN